MAATAHNRDWYLARERGRARAAQVVVGLADRRTRLSVLALAIVFTLWQMYAFAWLPLREEAELPAGLTAVAAQIDTATLAKIREARTQRLQHAPDLFFDADRSFAVSPTVPQSEAP